MFCPRRSERIQATGAKVASEWFSLRLLNSPHGEFDFLPGRVFFLSIAERENFLFFLPPPPFLTVTLTQYRPTDFSYSPFSLLSRHSQFTQFLVAAPEIRWIFLRRIIVARVLLRYINEWFLFLEENNIEEEYERFENKWNELTI